MKLNNIKLFVLDLDDTLYREMDFVIGGFRYLANVLADGDNVLSQKLFDNMVQLQCQGHRDIFQQILNMLNRPTDQNTIDELIRIYRTADRPLSLFPDAQRIINKLRSRNLPVAILTDGALEAQRTKVKLLNIESQIDKIIYTDELGRDYWKPSTKGFELLMEYFHTAPTENVYIADNEEKDFFAPNILGWLTIKIQRPDGVHYIKSAPTDDYRPQHIIDTLDKILL